MSAIARRNAFEDQWAGPNPATCDDLRWWEETGMCGGCGEETCHVGPCSEAPGIDPMYGYKRLLCDLCEYRQAQGWWS
jgi:hypothetical protein